MVKEYYQKLPAEGRRFIIRALLLFIGWKLLYNFILIPADIPDRQLSVMIGKCTAWFLSLFYTNTAFEGINFVTVNGARAVKITASCNGLELMVLFTGFLFCLPASKKRIAMYFVVGITGIFLLNVLRCSALAVMKLNHHSLAHFAHHYAFKIMVYGFVFYLWVLYSKKAKPIEI